MFQGAISNVYDNNKIVQHEDLTRVEKLKSIKTLTFFSSLLIILGGIVCYFGYLLSHQFNNFSNTAIIGSGGLLIIVGVIGILTYLIQIKDMESCYDQWFESQYYSINKYLFVISCVTSTLFITNFFLQKFSYKLAEYKFIAQYGEEKGIQYFQEQYGYYLQIVFILLIVSLLLIVYSAYVGHAFYKNNSKNTRDVIYILGLILLLAVLYILYYSEQIFQLLGQNYFPTSKFNIDLIYGIQITGLCYVIAIIFVYIVNFVKNKIWYINVTALLILLATVMISLNGNLFRMTDPIVEQYIEQQSCKKYIRWVPEPTLQKQGCKNKYTEYMGPQATRPLSCPQSDQMFTSNDEQIKYGMTACLEKECCGVMNILFTSQIINIASLCVFVPIFSMILMYTSFFLSNKYQQKSGVSTSEIIFFTLLILLLISGGYVIIQQKIGTVEQLENEFNDLQKLNTISVSEKQNLNHSHKLGQNNNNIKESNLNNNKFLLSQDNNNNDNDNQDQNKRILANYEQTAMQLNNCDYLNNLIQPQIQPILSENICLSKNCENDGIRVSLLANGGIFSKNLHMFNNEKIQIFDQRVLDLIFDQKDIQEFGLENWDIENGQFLSFQGKLEDLQEFLDEKLQFCLQQPFDVQLKVDFTQIDMSFQNSENIQIQFLEGIQVQNRFNVKVQQRQNLVQNNQQQQQQQNNGILQKFQKLQKQHQFSDVKIELFNVENGQLLNNLDINIQVYMDILECKPALLWEPMFEHKINNYSKNNNNIYLNNLPVGYYTIVIKVKGYNISCQELNVNESNNQIVKRVPLVKENEHRIILQWNNPKVSDTCYASLLNPSCEGMKFINYQENNGFQSIKINKYNESDDYLVFVNQYVDQQTLDNQKELSNLVTKNQIFLESDPKVFYYVPELEYPAEIIRMPFVDSQQINNYKQKLTYSALNSEVSKIGKIEYEKNLAWLVMCLDGSQGDIASKIQQFWVEKSKVPYISKDKDQLYPTLSICQQMKDWKE